MLEEKDLQAITQLMTQLLHQQKQEILGEMDGRLAQQKQELLAEMAKQKQELLAEMAKQKQELLAEMDKQKREILKESSHNMRVMLDTEVTTKFNYLAEQIDILMERQIDPARIERLEDEISVHRTMLRQINEDIKQLKKAQ